ncbi:uncharacterized protein JCM10292_002605 [Rhodotorula paludigena]|uniref:uncharacterized protein n=1 Tax=Rhodotorula paludigena TaxID=86838 RepID=UPI00316D38B3
MASVPAKRPSRHLVALLVIGMLVCGCSNSLWTKWQDMACVANCDSPNPAKRENFEQPVWQTANMFLGETFCLLAFSLLNSRLNPLRLSARRRAAAASQAALAASGGSRAHAHDVSAFSLQDEALLAASEDVESGASTPRSKGAVLEAGEEEKAAIRWSEAVLFWMPAMCDILGTTCMNIGLFFVPVSIYQMLRGALVLWVGVFSVVFLKRSLTRAQWVALAVCMFGVAIVGSSSLIGHRSTPEEADAAAEEGKVSPLVGVGLILVAQIFTASQFVIEERIMEHHAVEPLLAAGYEGFFGLITTMIGLLAVYWFYGSSAGPYFDMPRGWHEIVDHPRVWSSSIVIAFSIALFNFCGLAVTRTVSATARSTIDTSRTVGIWFVSLFLGWETFKLLQVVGFALLVYGTFTFNGITSFPHWTGLHRDALPAGARDADEEGEEDALLDASARRRAGSATRGEEAPLLRNAAD